MKLKKIFLSKEFLLRFIVVILVIAGVISKNYKLHFLLSSGLLLGTYYGLYNDIIWRPKGELVTSFPYRAHQLWAHIICGVVASLSLYFLLGVIDVDNQSATLAKLGLTEFMLFIITVMGYIGLLPRILWYFSYAQSIFSSK